MAKTKFDEAQELEYEKSKKIGIENLEMISKGKAWCKHFRCKMVSSGLLAEMYQLPIGSHRVSCQFSEYETESMNLGWIVPDFIIKSCENCEHRESGRQDAWGNELFSKNKKQIEESAKKEKDNEKRLESLRSAIRKIPESAKDDAQLIEKQVLIYLTNLFSDDPSEREEAYEKLLESTKIGPELFPKVGIELLLSQSEGGISSSSCFDLCCNLASSRSDFQKEFVELAKKYISKGVRINEASLLFAETKKTNEELTNNEIKSLIKSQYRCRDIGMGYGEPPDYGNAENLLVKLFETNPELTTGIFEELILNSPSDLRANICKTLESIQRQIPEIGMKLIIPLVEALELPDQRYNESADGCARSCIALTMENYPEKVDEVLYTEFKKRRTAVKDQILSVYEDKTRDLKYSKNVHSPEAFNHLNGLIVDRSYKILIENTVDLSLRVKASECMGSLVKQISEDDQNKYFDLLLGFYTEIAEEQEPPKKLDIWLPGRSNDLPDQLKALDEYNTKSEWSRFKRSILRSIKKIAVGNKEHVKSLINIYNSLDSKVNVLFKSDLTSMLGYVGARVRLRHYVLPTLMHALMDMNSTLNRYSALGAIREAFQYSSKDLPENMLDSIVLHLQDQYVIVHKAAVDTLQRLTYNLTDIQKTEAFVRLANLVSLYKNDPYFLKEIFSCLFSVSRNNDNLKAHAIKVLNDAFPTNEEYVDSDLVKSALYLCSKKVPYYGVILDMVLFNLVNYERDRYNNYSYSDRFRFIDWLYEVPKGVIFKKRDNLIKASKRLVANDQWEGARLIALFSKMGDFEIESELLEEAASSLGTEHRTKEFKDRLMKLSSYARVNFLVVTGDTSGAEAKLNQLSKEVENE